MPLVQQYQIQKKMIALPKQSPNKFEIGKVHSNPFHRAFKPIEEEEDHEVSMVQGLLDDIIKNATELKEKIGESEKDIPAWIQDHISKSHSYIDQANTNYHKIP